MMMLRDTRQRVATFDAIDERRRFPERRAFVRADRQLLSRRRVIGNRRGRRRHAGSSHRTRCRATLRVLLPHVRTTAHRQRDPHAGQSGHHRSVETLSHLYPTPALFMGGPDAAMSRASRAMTPRGLLRHGEAASCSAHPIPCRLLQPLALAGCPAPGVSRPAGLQQKEPDCGLKIQRNCKVRFTENAPPHTL
jgi:hypothetical protein